ncbi:discoidin domain-containing protein [Chitinophaga sp. NPDC101104]|uniref:discoidin domain-containing protein n=1 Tax=Chitinophaga sp. NPDC101104 TaxID=3390561 RepID=UPI003D06D40F
MKTLYNFLAYAMIAASVVSCSDDAVDLPDQPLWKYEKVYMPQAVNNPARYTLLVTDQPQSLVYGANYGGQEYPAADIPVSFTIEPKMVDTFNEKNGTSWPILPASSYEFVQKEGVIPKGGLSTQPFEIKVKTTGTGAIDVLTWYLLPVTLHVGKGSIAVNEELKTTYYLVRSQPNMADYPEYARDKWTIAGFSSEEPAEAQWGNGGQAVHTLDGNNGTFWHSAWKDASPGPPHHITVSLGEEKELHGLWFIDRQNDQDGKPKEVEVQISMDGTTWTTAGAFTLEKTLSKQKQFLSGFRKARYFKVIFKSAYDASYCHLAELGAF